MSATRAAVGATGTTPPARACEVSAVSRVVPIVMVVSVVAGCLVAFAARSNGEEAAPAASPDRVAASRVSVHEKTAIERFDSSIDAKPGSRRPLGEFTLAGGRSLRLYSVETRNGKSCLVDEDPGVGQSAGCLEGGLFGLRRAAFSVNTDGGPDRFDELYLIGVAAPGIRGVDVVETDGSHRSLELNSEHAFLFQSSPSDLAAGVYPKGLRLYSAAGRLVETITLPPLG